MKTLVLDGGVLTAFLIGADEPADLIRASLANTRLAAPVGVDLRVTEILHTLAKTDRVPPKEAVRALELLRLMQLDRHTTTQLTTRIWSLRGALSPYDAACAALAELLGAELLTLDPAFAAAPLTCPVHDLRHQTDGRSLVMKRS